MSSVARETYSDGSSNIAVVVKTVVFASNDGVMEINASSWGEVADDPTRTKELDETR